MTIRISFLIFIGMIAAEKLVGQSNKVIIEIASIERNEGQIYVALFKPGSKFPQVGNQFLGKVVSVASNKPMLIDFDLLSGEYAVAVFQDLNGNKELDTNFFGIPKEPYAFSNNVRPKFSPPKFEACKFQISGAAVKLRINLIN